MEKIKSFKELRIWQKGIEVVKEAYRLTKIFPKEERYVLTSQIHRSAVSIPSNIAEGFKRLHKKEFRQFLHIALGSAAELETQLIISSELGFIDEEQLLNMTDELTSLSKMTSSLLNRLK